VRKQTAMTGALLRIRLSKAVVRTLYGIFIACKLLMVNGILVEAEGVELSSVLTARKLLIPRAATTAKKAPLSDPLYVYCTKILLALEPNGHLWSHSIP
jgi:hypothetical protein